MVSDGKKTYSCEDVISELNSFIQDQIFLPSVVIDETVVLIREKAKWSTQAASPNKARNSRSSIEKENQNGKGNQSSSATLMIGK